VKNWIIGIDVAGSGIVFQIESASSSEKRVCGKASADLSGYRHLLARCAEAGVPSPAELTVVIEATGRHHLPWCERLVCEGAEVLALNPLLTKRLYAAENAIRQNKDDRIDAHTLCEMGRLHYRQLKKFTYKSQADRLALQSLLSARLCLRTQLTNLLKSAGDLLRLAFPKCPENGYKLTSKGLRRVIREAPTPEQIAALAPERVSQLLGVSEAEPLIRAARESLSVPLVAQACSPALKEMIDAIEDLEARLRLLDREIESTLAIASPERRRNEELLRSLPGFGPKTVAVIAAFLPPDMLQWGNRKAVVAKLQAYFGCDPRRKESGTFKGKVKISKRGIGMVRTALYQASFCGIKHDPQLKAYYDKKKGEGDHHNKAIIDLIRKNLRRIVAVLDQDTPYQPQN